MSAQAAMYVPQGIAQVVPPSAMGLPRIPAAALARDMTMSFVYLGMEMFRASVVDISAKTFLSAWAVSEHGQVSDESHPSGPLDSVFPGAVGTIAQLDSTEEGHAAVQRLSPRRWLFAWRIDERQVVVAEARFRDGRLTVDEIDKSLIRLLCHAGLPQPAAANEFVDTQPAALKWAEPEGLVSTWRASPSWWAALALSVLCALAAIWLALAAIPGAQNETLGLQSEVTRLRSTAASTMVQGLSVALATGDYGEVQNALSALGSQRYFEGAVVTNARERVVALEGRVGGLRAGDVVPLPVAQASRVLDLDQGKQRLGQLVIIKAPADSAPLGNWAGLRAVAMLVFVAATGSALFLLLQKARRRRL